MASTSGSPQVAGAGLVAKDATTAEAMDISGMTLNTQLYVTGLAQSFALFVSSATVDHTTVLSVSGNSGLRWLAIGVAPDSLANVQAIAQKLLGRSDLLTWWHPAGAAGAAGVTSVNGGTATSTPSSGALRLQAGATSGGLARLYPFSPDGSNFMQLVRAGQPWVLQARFALITTPTTGTIMSIGANNVSAHLRMGVDVPNGNASNFMLDGPSGTTMNSGIAFDTTQHQHYAWRTGGVTNYQIDGTPGTPTVTGNVDVALDSGPLAWVGNGTNANQGMDLEYWAVSAPLK